MEHIHAAVRTPEQIRRSIAAQAGVLVASKGCPPNAAAQMIRDIEALMAADLHKLVRITVKISDMPTGKQE